ncbi:MAG: ROK family protein [Actinomycetaceae bacterium]|nr:ROK family protein [Actinomycetaceae bacterium]
MNLVCVDIGGTKVAASIVSVFNQPQLQGELSCLATPATEGREAVLRAITTAIDRLLPPNQAVTGISIASAGVIDRASGKVTAATDLLCGWAGTPLGELISKRYKLPVTVMNDVHAHAVGEFRIGAGKGAKHGLQIAVGTGIGGALICDEKIQSGASGISGHIGHVSHPLAEKMLCSCGKTGHIEAVCSGSGLPRLHSKLFPDFPLSSGREVAAAALAGDRRARQTLVTAGTALGNSIGNIANVVDPEVIVISGSVARAGEAWWNAVRHGYQQTCLPALENVEIVVGSLGSAAPLIGAAYNFIEDQND